MRVGGLGVGLFVLFGPHINNNSLVAEQERAGAAHAGALLLARFAAWQRDGHQNSGRWRGMVRGVPLALPARQLLLPPAAGTCSLLDTTDYVLRNSKC